MATETPANGTSSTTDGLSAAERLMKQHAADEAEHHATVEDVQDEEFTVHPPPSAAATHDASRTSAPAAESALSAKAAGKQPVRDQPAATGALDTSEAAFPALGAPKTQPVSAAPTPWSRKPASVGKAVNGVPNGVANGSIASSTLASRTSSPPSGIVTPSSMAASQRGPPPQVNLPGRYSEQIQLPSSMMTPRNQLKKSIPDILRDINKKSKANVEMKAGPGGVVVFEGTGPVDAVRTTLKEVATQLCGKQSLALPVPASVRGKIVGKQGATIQAISKKTGARINISKQEVGEVTEDDETMVDVLIEGDPFAVQMARQEIERIVSEHTSSVNTRLKHIPAEYYPFLAGPHNSRVKALQENRDLKMHIPQYQTWKNVAPPQTPLDRQPVQFTPQGHLPIQLSGDRQAVAEARAEIDRQVAELQRQITLEQMAIERGRHQFIVGDLGTSLNDFMKETGCSVILPPEGDDSEMLTVVGPSDRIEEGMNKIMDLASSMSMASADIARQHANAPRGAQAHARDITRYLQQRQAIEQLERTHNARIVPDSAGAWQIYARDGKNAMKARSDIMNLISGHPPTRFYPLEVDPFYHQHLREQAANHIREQHGVHVVVPDDGDDAPVLLVFEDSVPATDYELPRRQPSAQDARAFEQALRLAQQHILDLMTGREEIVSRDVDAPVKFHDKIRRHVDRHHDALPEGSIPLQVLYGGPPQPQQRKAPVPSVSLRGPQNEVDVLMQSLLAFIEQEKRDELERGFTLDFDFPQKYANHLIGRKGENINRLREEFDVEIQVNEGKCEIKGPEAKANACKKHILDMLKKLEDETTHHLNIPSQYHRDLIGPQGSQVHRLQDRYNVRVNFPKTRQVADEAASEAGESTTGRRNDQLPNEVIIKGPSKGADGCREELLSLLQYVKDNSFTATVMVAQSQLPSLIGAGGKEMDALRLQTGAQIDVPGAKDAASPTGRAEIKIKGSKKAVEEAKKLIEEKAKVFDNTVTRNLDVDRRHHRLIIGPQGSNLRGIITQAGGPDDVRLHNRMVRFPKAETDGNMIRIEGQRAIVDQICASIEEIVAQQESQTTTIAEVKPEKHRLLIGRGGEIRRQLEQQFNVSINVPRQNETGPQRSQVRIAGQPEAVEQAKTHILDMTKDVEGETISVPRRLHHSISDNGQFFRRLRNDHKVTVDHAGQKPPPRPSALATPTRTTNGTTPLITDDPIAAAEQHSWSTHALHTSTEEGDIPWILSGSSPENIATAKSKLEQALAEAMKQDTVGFLILPDPRTYRHIIGTGGSEINRIRKASGAKIQVPRDQEKGEAIEIVGTEEGVEKARELILEVVGKNAA